MAGKVNKKLFGFTMGKDKWFLVLLTGIAVLILLFPSGGNEKKKTEENNVETGSVTDQKEYHELLEERLRMALAQVEGVGNTDVMITLKSTEEKQVEKNNSKKQSSLTESDSQGGSRVSDSYEEDNTVILAEDENGNQVPYVVKSILPQIEGVLVVCEGGDKASVKSEVYEAVEALLGVPVHKIKVLKKVSESK